MEIVEEQKPQKVFALSKKNWLFLGCKWSDEKRYIVLFGMLSLYRTFWCQHVLIMYKPNANNANHAVIYPA